MRRALHITLIFVGVAVVGVWLWLEVLPRTISVAIPAGDLQRDSGYAYIYRLPAIGFMPIAELRSDGLVAESASRLELLEDGHRLGPAHALHEAVREHGHGAFSHWGDQLYFSSSDGTSPADNGRAYRAEAPLTPSLWLRGFGALALGWIALRVTKRLANTKLGRRVLATTTRQPQREQRKTLGGERAYRQPSYNQIVLFSALVITSVAILSSLVDRNYLHAFEADAQSTIEFTLAAATGDVFLGRPKPYSYPPYFDAQYFFYALVYYVARLLQGVSVIAPDAAPTPQSIAILAIRHANLAAYSLSVGTSFLIFRELSARTAIALLLTSYLLFSPHMLNIDLMRVDHVVLALFLTTFYLTLRVAKSECRLWVHIFFGIVAAALCFTKITSVLFLVAPLLGYAYAIQVRGFRLSGALPWAVSFSVSALFFLARFIPYEIATPGFTLKTALDKLAEVERWRAVLPTAPRFFYNWDQFQNYGFPFLAVFCAAFVWLIVRLLRQQRSFADMLIVGLLVLFSLVGYFSFKYARGFYVLAPLYLAVIARASLALPSATCTPFGRGKRLSAESVLLGICWAALLAGLAWPVSEYRRVEQAAALRQESIRVTKLNPVTWLSQHLWAGARVTVLSYSELTNPSLDGLQYDVRYRFLDFPYLEPTKMADYRPPSLQEVETSTDAIVLNDYLLDYFLSVFSTLGLPDRRREWEEFFSLLRRIYPVERFEAASPAYGVRVVEVITVHTRRE